MYLQFGAYKFEGIKLPQSWATSNETIYSQIPIINGKAVVQKIAEKLKEIEFSVFFSSEFCVPKDEIDKLDLIRMQGQINQLIDGTGRNHGKYVLVSIGIDYVATLDNGYPTAISATIKLLEYNANTKSSIKSGLATNATPQIAKLPIPNNGIKVNNELNIAKLKAAEISKLPSNPTFAKLQKIKTSAAALKAAISNVKDGIDKSQKMANRVNNGIHSSIAKVKTGADNIQSTVNKVGSTYSTARAVTNIKTYSDQINTAMEDIKIKNTAIIALIAGRDGNI